MHDLECLREEEQETRPQLHILLLRMPSAVTSRAWRRRKILFQSNANRHKSRFRSSR